MKRRRAPARLRWALATSAVAHAALIGLFWAVARSSAEVPRMRVYAVSIVSPPPQAAGDWNPTPVEAPPAEPEASPEPEPEAEPEPPAPEPSPAPATTSRPAPKEPPRPAPKETPKETPRPAPKAAPKETPKEAPRPAPKAAPSTGARPDPSSAGGEGINLQLEGVRCPSEAYCENIVRQLYRYFRPPASATSEEAEIFFYINRDGSVSDIRVVRSTGTFPFRAAAMEAVEQAGRNRSFGRIPSDFSVDRLPVSFSFRPDR